MGEGHSGLSPIGRRRHRLAVGARMISRISRLESRIEELEELLGMRAVLPRITGFGVREWSLLGLLVRHRLVTREFAFPAIYGELHEDEQPAGLRIIDTIIHRLRVLLKPRNIVIETEKHTGYYFDEENRRRAAELVGSKTDPHRPIDAGHGGGGDLLDHSGKREMGHHGRGNGLVDRPHLAMARDDMAAPKHKQTHPHHA